MRYQEITETSLDVIQAAQTIALQHGVAVNVTANGPHEIDLTWLKRTSGQKGSGGKFLADLIQFADQHHVRIMLAVWHREPKLIDLYKRFGFVVFDEGDEDEEPIMLRDPQ